MFSDDDDTIEYDSPARRSAPVGAVSGGAGILAAAACGGRCACAEGRRRAGGPFPGDEGLYGDLCGRRRRLCRRRKLCRRGRPLLHARGRCRGLLRRRFEMGGRSLEARGGGRRRRHAEPQLAGQPDAGVRFPGRRLPQRTAALRRRGAPSAAHAGRQGGGDEFDHGRRRRRRIAACGDLRSRRRADAYRDPADRTVGRGAALRCGGLRRLRADRFPLRRAGDGSGVSERSETPLPFGYSPPSTVCSATRRR